MNEAFRKRSEKGIKTRMFRDLRLHAHVNGYNDQHHPYYCYSSVANFKTHCYEMVRSATRIYVLRFFGTESKFLPDTKIGSLSLREQVAYDH